MESVLKMAAASLGIVVPLLFLLALGQGIAKAAMDDRTKATMTKLSWGLIVAWTALVWVLSLAHVFEYHPGDKFPRFLLPLFLPVVVGVVFLMSGAFRTLVKSIPLSWLVGVQIFRLAGVAFIPIVMLNILPSPFVSGGYGDLATGLLALITTVLLSRKAAFGKTTFVAFSVVGLADLVNVLLLLLYYYPQWYTSVPNSAPAAAFSLVMIPALAAPIALLLHLFAILNVLQGGTADKKAAA
jgi:hypothetical protein